MLSTQCHAELSIENMTFVAIPAQTHDAASPPPLGADHDNSHGDLIACREHDSAYIVQLIGSQSRTTQQARPDRVGVQILHTTT